MESTRKSDWTEKLATHNHDCHTKAKRIMKNTQKRKKGKRKTTFYCLLYIVMFFGSTKRTIFVKKI